MPPPGTTRPAIAADAPALRTLVNSAFRGDTSRAGWTTEADLLDGQRVDVEGLLAMVDAPGHVVLLQEHGAALVGCVHLERTGDECHVGLLAIRPTAQGAGRGRALLEAAERWAVDHWGSRAAHMTVITLRVELVAWYERRGYRRTGVRKPFPYGDTRFGLPRRPDLEFEVLRKLLAPG